MHVLERVQVTNGLADIPEVPLDLGLRQLPITVLDLVVETASLCELQYHIGHVLIFLVVVVD